MSDYFLQRHRLGLFRSNAWLQAWQITWGDCSAIRIACPNNNHPLSETVYTYQQKIKKIIAIKTAFPLGVSTSAAPSLRSEYFTLFEDFNHSPSEIKNYIAVISKLSWSQFYIPDILVGSAEWHGLKNAAHERGWKFVVKEVSNVYGVDVASGSFSDYLKCLGANTRLKLFNRRKNLELFGSVNIKNIWPNKELFFKLINGFHESRWGKPCYQGKSAEFISLLLDNLNDAGHKIDLSVMKLNNQPISVVLDVSINGRIYNLQSGYLEELSKKISLGTLHFGYQIERAFLSEGIDFYDFMAGEGKNANYKAALANKAAEFNTVYLVRNPMLKFLYCAQEKFS